MDPRYHTYQAMPSEGAPSTAYPLLAQSAAPVRNGTGGSRIMAPEDVDGALRYSPLTSAVPVSGGKTPFYRPICSHN